MLNTVRIWHNFLKLLRRKQTVSSKFPQELHGLLIPIGFRAATSDVFILRNSPRLLTSHVVYLSSWHKEISLGYLCRRNSFSFSETFSLSVTLPVSQASSFQHGSSRGVTRKKCCLAFRKFSPFFLASITLIIAIIFIVGHSIATADDCCVSIHIIV
jgi:hypothetical protein